MPVPQPDGSRGMEGQQPHRAPSGIENLIDSLQISISDGDEGTASQIAKLLAGHKVHIDMQFKTFGGSCERVVEEKLSVKVYVEDRETTATFITLDVTPSTTIEDLKIKMLRQFGFPPEIQRWIISKKLPKDNDTLAKCGVKTNNTPIFLYLMSTRSQGLTKDTYLQRYGAFLPPGVYIPEEEHEEAAVSLQSGTQMPVNPAAQAYVPQPTSPPGRVDTLPVSLPTRLSTASPGPSQGSLEHGVTNAWGPEAGTIQGFINAPGSLPLENVPEPLERLDGLPTVDQVGWACPQCTLINVPTKPGCEICGAGRPEGYVVPERFAMPLSEQERLLREQEMENLARETQDRERREAFEQLLRAERLDLVHPLEEFDCPICFDTITPEEGVKLRDCLHVFCRDCLSDHVKHCEDAIVKCPFQDGRYICNVQIQEREIKALVPPDLYQKHLERSLRTAESQAANSYHCKTPDCHGWCYYDDDANFFDCPVCGHQNCLTCKALHEGMNCRQYQEDLEIKAMNDQNARRTREMLEQLLLSGEAMRCPTCNIVVQKKEGCDWIQCTMCKTEICWVTKGPRWGPQGAGDTSGGCGCNINGQRCHPECGNCH